MSITSEVRIRRVGVVSLTVFFMLISLSVAYYASLGWEKNYKGVISESKEYRSGVLIDLDGIYPNQRMTVFVPHSIAVQWASLHHRWPQSGAVINAAGKVTTYKGREEIVIEKVSKLNWDETCDEHNDVASASLLENWIDEGEKRVWFLFELTRNGN